MKERPIIFNGEMVRAIREGRKTQTRRVVKPQPDEVVKDAYHTKGLFVPRVGTCSEGDIKCPYGVPGDRLWVRETWQGWKQTSHEYDEWEPMTTDNRGGLNHSEYREEWGGYEVIEYAATSDSMGPWNPSIHMPRWASRMTLAVKSVRVERVQDISEEDAKAEGIISLNPDSIDPYWGLPGIDMAFNTARAAFRWLWDSINLKRGHGWDENDWVWVPEWPKWEEAS